MGDLIGNAVEGNLYWLSRDEFDRLRRLRVDVIQRTALLADACRLNALYMIARAGSGHIGSSFSSLDIVTWLHENELRVGGPDGDLYFSSKGHDAPGLYAVLLGLGRLPFEQLHRLRQLDGLPGHPDTGTPGIVTNSGSLGMGISKAKGLAMAARLRGSRQRVFVLTGDGELQEGQIWESLLSAARLGLSEITVVVDHNKLQSDTFVASTSDLGDLESKFRAFDWHVARVDGHDLGAFGRVLGELRGVDRPKVIIADTIKGRGVSFMEHTALDSDVALYRFHSGAPTSPAYAQACAELIARLNQRCDELDVPRLGFEQTRSPKAPSSPAEQRLIPAYARALLREMCAVPNVVALDADLTVDTGQVPAREAFPERHLECGIAEMDMVSMAGGLALGGQLPICHSFACFLSTRANEQIYNNATEHTQVIYVASLAGLLPAGPGHSHQSVRDISAVGGVPGLIALSPSSEAEVEKALHFCIHEHRGSSWLRLESVACSVPYELPRDHGLVLGRGTLLRPGTDALFIGYGPVLLSEAYFAAESLAREGLSIAVLNLPWLNHVEPDWLLRTLEPFTHVFALDNHYVVGGQGDRIADVIAGAGLGDGLHLHRCAVESIPACGRNAEVLKHHGLDRDSLSARVRRALGHSAATAGDGSSGAEG
jgi:transketolase